MATTYATTSIPMAGGPATPTPADEIIAALRKVEPLEGLTDAEYRWLAGNGQERVADKDQMLFLEGAPVYGMVIILKGEIHVRRQHSGPMALFTARSGQITGLLPFSQMKTYGGDGYAVSATWVLDIPQALFPEMLKAIPPMAERAVRILLTRVREVTRMEQQAEKLNALGKLAGNLSHELNNPASAAQRSAASLLGELRHYGDQKYQLGTLCIDDAQKAHYGAWVTKLRAQIPTGQSLSVTRDPLVQATEEDKLTRWLSAHGDSDPWMAAATLAEAGISTELLDELAAGSSPQVLPVAIRSFASALRAERMTEAVLESTARIFDLIRAIKDYSYMDQAPIQEVDLAQALEATLAMQSSRLAGITVEREYDLELPPISAYGSELNQVWMELIENAVEAMPNGGTLKLRTQLNGPMAMVEIWDSGPGIPPELSSRIFEPFFTTKAPGSGLGLGLDSASRIVSKHRGFIHVESKPGATCFQIRLPLTLSQAY